MRDDLPTASVGLNPKPGGGAGVSSGDHVGRYKLLQVLGEGGFGVVFEAEQSEPVRRRVALKVIKPGMDSGAVVARFEAERQALAVMDHPCIAKIFDGGVTSPAHGQRPYFAMELVKGVPITEHCDTHRLNVRERCELFVLVCEAVQHAHSKGVVHRDLKPSNILVSYDETGLSRPKVIDFGIAKALSQRLAEGTIFTQQGQLIGTPEYMSPEQAEMSGQDVDTRADVYSLGVVLYELLSGSLPFESKTLREAGFGEIQRIIREVAPARPSTRLMSSAESGAKVAGLRRTDLKMLGGTLRRDLDWVVMKCLEKDRSRRYDTADALAMDLGRYLSDEPVVAGPPSAGYRASKFIKRHRWAIVGVGSIGISMLVATAVSVTTTIGVWRANERTRLALSERDEAFRVEQDRSRQLAEVADFQSDQLASIEPETMGEWMRVTLLDSMPEGDRSELRDLLNEVNFTGLASGTLEQHVFEPSLRTIERRFEDQPLIRARLLQSIADTMRELGMLDGALNPQREALAIRRAQLGDESAQTLDSLGSLGRLERLRGEYDASEAHTREVLEGRRELLGDDHPDTLASINNLGFVLQAAGELEEGEQLIRRAYEGRRRILGEDDPSTLVSMSNMGIVLIKKGELDEALRFYEDAVAGLRRVLGADDPVTLHSVNNLGLVYAQQGEFDEAMGLWTEALDGYRRIYGDGHPATLVAMHNLAKLMMVTGEYERGEALALESEQLNRERWGAGDSETREATELLVQLYEAWHEAEGGHETELDRWRQRLVGLEGGG